MSTLKTERAGTRFTAEDVATWQRDGAVLLRSFFSRAEIDPVADDFNLLFSHLRPQVGNRTGTTYIDCEQHSDLHRIRAQTDINQQLPFDCSPALNLIGLHPALLEFAKAALQSRDMRVYQYLAWPKFTGRTDYDQPIHMDYRDHTLTVLGDCPADRTLTVSIYASDVTDQHGAIHYVPRPEGDEVCGKLRPYEPDVTQQTALRSIERSGSGPIGSVFAYAPDVYHRGTNLTANPGYRYTVFVSYKTAQNDAVDIGLAGHFDVKRRQAIEGHRDNPGELLFTHATPEQLVCLNVPPPGHPFWTELTVARAQKRWPTWDLDPWRRAHRAKVCDHENRVTSREG